ncbi:MAG: domain containing protein, partial [Myxococcales bacterium]|nr:domain containing protein [Myxococcales bacterium]
MAGRPSNRDGDGDDRAFPPDAGLDAKLDRAVPSGDADAFLLGVGGNHGGRVYPLSHNTVFIGRSELADVHVSDASVSGQHAKIINGSLGFEIEDLGSTNGTTVEGQRVTRARLRSGDRLTVGQIEFKFLVDRRVDATMTIIPSGLPTGAPRRDATGVNRDAAVVLYQPPPRARSEQSGGAPFVAPARDEDEGISLEEIIARLAVAYRYLQQNFRLIAFFAGIGVFVGIVSAVLLPPPGETICMLKLQPQIKTNPVDATWGRGWSDDQQEVRFFASAETAFVQPELVGETLRKLLKHPASDGTVASFAERLRLEPGTANTYKAVYKEKLIGGSTPTGPEFLTAHLETYFHREIERAIRTFAAQAEFLRDQLTTVEKEMKRISDEKMQFSQKNSDRLPEEAGQMLGSRFELETRRAELTAQVRKLQGDLDAQRRALADEGPLASNKFGASQVYRQSLADLNRKLSEAYARGLADGHPEVIALKDEKQRLEGLIQKEMASETTAIDRRSN